MNRATALNNLAKLKAYKHYSVEAYSHIAKLFEYTFYEIDRLNQLAVEAPSVYGSFVEEPNYKDYSDDEEAVELPEVVEEDIEASYIDDSNIPLVLATNAMLTPFQPLSSEPEKEKPTTELEESPAEVVEPDTEASRDTDGAKVAWTITKDDSKPVVKPKRLKIVGETDKTSLHSDGLKRVKENLKSFKKKSKKA